MPVTTRISAGNVKLKRAYEPLGPDDGTRVLVDRLWPRGVSKDDAAVDLWPKDLAPSTELRARMIAVRAKLIGWLPS